MRCLYRPALADHGIMRLCNAASTISSPSPGASVSVNLPLIGRGLVNTHLGTRIVVVFTWVVCMSERGDKVQAGSAAGWLGLMRHAVRPVGPRQRSRVRQASKTTGFDDIGLHNVSPASMSRLLPARVYSCSPADTAVSALRPLAKLSCGNAAPAPRTTHSPVPRAPAQREWRRTEYPLLASKASGKPSPRACSAGLGDIPARSASRVVLSASKRFHLRWFKGSHASTTRQTSSTLRTPLLPIEA